MPLSTTRSSICPRVSLSKPLRGLRGKLTNCRSVPEPPEDRSEPLSTVPFSHDEDSVSRDALLDQIHKKVLVPGSRVALVGLGGVGSENTIQGRSVQG